MPVRQEKLTRTRHELDHDIQVQVIGEFMRCRQREAGVGDQNLFHYGRRAVGFDGDLRFRFGMVVDGINIYIKIINILFNEYFMMKAK